VDQAVVIVQARMGSTRLPGKVLADLAGTPLLAFMVARLAAVEVGPVIVATSDRPADDRLADLGRELGVVVVRGAEQDVLGRFLTALDQHPARHLVRVTADCPLIDPGVVADTVATHLAQDGDYTSNTIVRTFPDGLDVEVARVEALREAAAGAVDAAAREHVTPALYRRPDRYRLAAVTSPLRLGHLRWTVDTAADLEAVRALVAATENPRHAPWTAFLGATEPTPAPEGTLVPLLAGSWSGRSGLGPDWVPLDDPARSRPDPSTWWGRCLLAGGTWADPGTGTFGRAFEVHRHGSVAGWAALQFDGRRVGRWGAATADTRAELIDQLDRLEASDLQFSGPR
jgi:spore coat polysaccharide biosynthesis protein SpsF